MRAIFFDLDGTLVALPDSFAELFAAALADHGVRADDERHEFFTEAFFERLDDCHPEPYRAAMSDLGEAFGLDAPAEELAESYAEREAAAIELRVGARETLDALAAAESAESAAADSTATDSTAGPTDTAVALGVLTNGGGRGQRRKLAVHGLADYFEAVVVSAEVGAGKPDPEIFAAARDAVPADEYVFVADDRDRDVRPAQRAGFTGVYVGESETEDANVDDAERPDHCVESLREVPALFEYGSGSLGG
ncbi:HAD family hydrolase [Halorussus gelatinilyticus]|uniref:HAD family hydrolase n=1 Tax=Halorussus gelatinilyticus TaxID=2937524 RepID=A0A8U0IDF2_9EURY|nr:HAD family hydrolase [Halorussus gelatinilyticus]UPV99089.1 HAD family hydrolase [Halorussus gelatinilyticus]